jgi:hypothetical protein
MHAPVWSHGEEPFLVFEYFLDYRVYAKTIWLDQFYH